MPSVPELSPGLQSLAESLRQKLHSFPAFPVDSIVAERAPDERLALAGLLQLAELSPDTLATALADQSMARDLAFCLGASEIVRTELAAAGDRWLDLFRLARTASIDSIRNAMRCDPIKASTREDAAAALGRFKRREFVKIAIADLLRRIEVAETARLMSALADECIRAGLDAARHLMGARAAEAGEFCVLAMGKLGADELNLSSDIDLVYLYDAPDTQSAAVASARIGELLTEILSDGSFRVDLRLRPGGRSSPLVVPFEGALSFYQNHGQTWERAALLRARPVAGAIALGERLIAELANFVYRRFLDFDTLRQLRAMKHQIEAELRSPDMIARNIKLGRGGIRELEFVAHSLTLIYGGRDPRIRTGNALSALRRLDTYGYMPQDRATALAEAYILLRDVEHKLQVTAGMQTQTLPADPAAIRALAARMGFGKDAVAAARLVDALERRRDLIASQFRETLAGGDEESHPAVSPQAVAAWSHAAEHNLTVPLLAHLGYAHPEESAGHLEALWRGPEHWPQSPRRRELLETLGPLLVDEMRSLADPDLAIMNLASFIAAVGARTSFLGLLEQHPVTRRVLLRLFASSRYLSTIFIRHPDMLDTLVRSDLVRARRTLTELKEEVTDLVGASPDFEGRLDALRAFRHQEFLRVAIADLAGELQLPDVETELTNLAEAVLAESLEIARADVAARIAIPTTLRMAILAMGRLGAGEMTYNSDLDLIFVYDDSSGAADAASIASRVAQRLIAVLESRTREGYAYKLDLRLRPSGNQGPLVTSLQGFISYHRKSSAVWERQALVRARVIAGTPALGAEVEAARQEFVFSRGLAAADVAEIAAMRERMAHEIGVEDKNRLNLKQGEGGLIDVEFLTQMMALRHGKDYPALRARNTRALLAALHDTGLIAPTDAAVLQDNFYFLARLENRLRIESDQPAWAVPTDHMELLPLARRMGFQGDDAPERLLKELQERRTRIHQVFEKYFTAESATG
ncbi:MAG TPA: bifunctional [glutamate--ammonia ligase]-adenylyl-L-tyrosine phosphorylase/[glutamate--ammonia-ligase] adenylyltransferase [Candidatus Binataceae bacterium]|nr:bifunctional [glutamate--ammonia ligase]-adenylyl-L-tyrosine phosphorylase/[glutamate--ammonia-ligase] adenylyltransferase [Candidatus Binataceae bacterium]